MNESITADHPRTILPNVPDAVATEGFSVIPGATPWDALELTTSRWDSFAAYWDDLVADPYIGPRPADQYRRRRYGRLTLHRADADADAGTLSLTPLPNRRFVQAAEHVARYGGAARDLEPATPGFLADPLLRRIVEWDYGCLPGPASTYEVGLHLIRIVVGPGLDSLPTPEGRHRDGHSFVAMHLISRRGCRGGRTRVYRQDRDTVLATVTMRDPLDTVVVDDTAVDHEVSSLQPVGAGGHRDVLLVAFYPPADPP